MYCFQLSRKGHDDSDYYDVATVYWNCQSLPASGIGDNESCIMFGTLLDMPIAVHPSLILRSFQLYVDANYACRINTGGVQENISQPCLLQYRSSHSF